MEEIEQSDLLLDYFKTNGWKQSLIDFQVKQRGLLIHSVITSRLVSSRESLYIVQDDHDRAVRVMENAEFCTAFVVHSVQGYCMHSGTV